MLKTRYSTDPAIGNLRLILLAVGLSASFTLAPPAAAAGPYPTNMCVGTRNGNLGCTANDIAIAQIEVTNGVSTCVAGTMVDVGLRLLLRSNANSRYDIGVFIAQDGRPPELPVSEGGSAACAVFGIPTSPPPLANLNGNACGDVVKNSDLAAVDLGVVSVLCVPDQNGRLRLPTTVTWEQNASGTCQEPPAAWVEAGAPSKCNASENLDVPVQVVGTVTIVKRTSPPASPGGFAFTASGAAPAAFALSDGQQQVLTTGPLTATPTAVTVTEAALAGWDPTADISCTSADGGPATGVTIDRANRSLSATLDAAHSRLTCTFTNKAESRIRVVKSTTGGDDTFPFVAAEQDFSIATSAGAGEFLVSGLSAGTHAVTELVPAGWKLTGLSCSDPTGGTTVSLEGKTATVALAVGETVTCTFTNDKTSLPANGVINVVKTTVGGDATFGFTAQGGGTRPFALTTSSGVSPAKAFTGLAAGTYTVTERVPAGWVLSSITCADPTGNSSGAGATATVDLAAGETVTCTFANGATAGIVVEKTALGGDGTFSFGGTASFSIATTSGSGRDETTFASVPGGLPVTIAESLPVGWVLSGAACRDATTNAPAGIAVANGVQVTPAAGQRLICAFTDTRLARLTVVEVSSPRVPQTFSYTSTGPGLANFNLDDGSGTRTRVFTDLLPGQTTSVTQSAVAGWETPLILCSDRNAPSPGDRTAVDLPNRRIAPSLQPGESLVCAFLNAQVAAGSIAVTKNAIGGDDSFAFANSGGEAGSTTNPPAFTITTASGSGSHSLTGLAPGRYTITEGVPAGWISPPAATCSVLSGSSTTITPVAGGVTVDLGQTGLAVDGVACTFENAKAARITVAEDATPDAPQVFAYSAQGAGLPPSFSLTNDGAPPPADRVAFAGLGSGLYRFAGTTPAGWRLTSIDCADHAGSAVDVSAGRTDVTLAPGDDVTCTYRHARESTLSVTKSASGAAPGDLFAFTGPVGLAGNYASGQTRSIALLPGTSVVSEIAPEGWTLSDIACTGGSTRYTGATTGATDAFEPGDDTAEVTTAAGDAVACTFTNSPSASAIVVQKVAVGGAGVFAFTGVEDFQIDTRLRMLPVHTISVAPGTWTVREIVPPGWRLTGLACTGTGTVDPATATATVTTGAGERVRCVFTNEKLGRIEVTKAIRGERTTSFSFSVPPALDPSQQFVLSPTVAEGSATRAFENVPTGGYLVTENGPATGFALQSIDCTDPTSDTGTSPADGGASIRLAPGESVPCTFTNGALGSITVGAASFLGQDGFDFTATNLPGGSRFTLATAQVTPNVSFSNRAFGSLPATLYTVTAEPPPPHWRFIYLQCVSDSSEQHWAISGPTAAIALAAGENVRCNAFFAPLVGSGEDPVAIPGFSVLSGLLFAALVAAAGWFALRR